MLIEEIVWDKNDWISKAQTIIGELAPYSDNLLDCKLHNQTVMYEDGDA